MAKRVKRRGVGMSKYVKLDDVKKVFYKQHMYHDFDNYVEAIKEGFMDVLNTLPTIELDEQGVKVEDEVCYHPDGKELNK